MKHLVIFAALVTLGIAGLAGGCTDETAARETLESSGFEDIQFDGYDPFACGNDDTTATHFTAKNSRGKKVSGTVCCGLFLKGCTVRF